MEPFDRLESEARSYCRKFPVLFSKAQGSLLFDSDGRRYIDFLSSAGAVNYGHNNQHLIAAIVEYLEHGGPITALDLHTAAKREFLLCFETLILKPRGLDYRLQFTSPTGTSVVESAVKLARKVTGRSNVIAFTNGFHGMSGVSLSLTGNRYNRQPHQHGNVIRAPFEHYVGAGFDTVQYLDRLLSDGSSGIDIPAAIILETVQAEGGVNVASREWLRRLKQVTEKHEILFIVDDIQVGCGRTGNFFSFETAGIVPDMVCLSKSLSGAGLPFSLLLLKRDLDAWKPGEDNGTFRGNNLAFKTATEALRRYWHDDQLTRHVSRLESVLRNRLEELRARFPQISDVRGRGLIFGIDFRNMDVAEKITQDAFSRGLILETCGAEDQIVKILPPLTITEELLLEGLSILEDATAVNLPPEHGKIRNTRLATA